MKYELHSLQEAYEAVLKVSDRQRQGFALVPTDFTNCMTEVAALNELLQRCVVTGDARAAGPAGGPGKASSKIAPSSWLRLKK